ENAGVEQKLTIPPKLLHREQMHQQNGTENDQPLIGNASQRHQRRSPGNSIEDTGGPHALFSPSRTRPHIKAVSRLGRVSGSSKTGMFLMKPYRDVLAWRS